jgi:hypothetical protein
LSKRILLCLSHSIEEYDQLRLLHGLGYEVCSIGGYIDPAHPHDDKRPALPNVPCVTSVKEAIDGLGTDDNLGAAQREIPAAVLDWLGADGVIIFHHYLDQRLWPQWEHLREWRSGGGRVVWRTVGQSVEANERAAAPYRADGLEIVRYSPRERNLPGYCGEDVMIRFYKDPAEWAAVEWDGSVKKVTNVTQQLKQRHPWTNYDFWRDATADLDVCPVGPGSEAIGGLGAVSLDAMKDSLHLCGAYLYTGTQPASYTLGLIEAMMVGIPVVSIGPHWMTAFPYGPDIFEGHLLAGAYTDLPAAAALILKRLLADDDLAHTFSTEQRKHTLAGFGMEPVGQAWKEFLG